MSNDPNDPNELVNRSLELLKGIRAELHSRSDTSLALEIDKAIALLEEAKRHDKVSPEIAREALRIVARGLAAIPALERLISWLSKD